MNRKQRRKQQRQQKQALKSDPSIKGLLQKARASLEGGDLANAEIEFRAVTERDNLNAEAFHMLALIAYQQGRIEDAGEMILEAITRNDDDPALHANCGAIMNLLGRPMEAEAASRHALEMKPDYAEAYNNLTVALEVQGRLDEALESGLKAIELNPDHLEAHINLGNLKLRRGEVSEAIEAYQAAIRIAPDSAMARANLGTALRQSGDLEAAEESCRQAIGLDPQYAEAHNSLGNVFKAKEDWEAAKGAFREALRCRKGYLDAHLNLARVMFKAGDVEGGEVEYRKILDTNDGLPEARAGLGVLLLAVGRLTDAVENFKLAVEAKPGLGIAQYNLATAAGAEMSEADVTDLREVLDDKRILESDRTLIHFALGEIGDRKGDVEAAFADFEAGNRLRKNQLARSGRQFDADDFDQRVDGIVSAYRAETFDQRWGGDDPTEQPVFIVGMLRSGTTLVEQIAASHPKVIGKGEMDLIRVLCGDDGNGDSGSDNAGADEKDLTSQASEFLARMRDQAEDAVRIIDKTPFNFLYLGRIQLMFPGARVVHCRRDALDTGLSCFRQYFTAPHEWACDLADIGRYHRAHERLMDHWQGVLSLPILTVNYEDLIGDQEKASRRLIEFLGLEWDPACLDFQRSKRVVFTASNWQVREPLYKSAIGRAKAYDKFLGPLKEGLKGSG